MVVSAFIGSAAPGVVHPGPAGIVTQVEWRVELSGLGAELGRGVDQFDARRLYSAPLTIFGPLLAVLYTGGHYMAFRDANRIETFTRDFDTLIREATRTARDFPDHLSEMRALIR